MIRSIYQRNDDIKVCIPKHFVALLPIFLLTALQHRAFFFFIGAMS